jgi:flagellar biosynthesis chaperone FliJ
VENKDSYRQKMQEQLDVWKEEKKKLRAQAQTAGSEAVKNVPDQIRVLEQKIKEGSAKLKELVDTNEEAFEALREGFDTAWGALSSGFSEAKSKFKWEKDKD